MKQADKSKRTYEKILKAAIQEFGTKSFDVASLNTICHDHQISKGLIYHNFENKDTLYLCCVKACFEQLTHYLQTQEIKASSFQETIEELMSNRYQFFKEHPYYANLFFHTMLQPPAHLIDQIKEVRAEFDAFNCAQYRSAISTMTLREGITMEVALEYFYMVQEMFNQYYQSKAYQHTDFHALIKDHEVKISKVLNLMLYGIAKEETHDHATR